MAYQTNQIDLDKLVLDTQNPRFIVPPEAEQSSVIRYLLENEDVLEVARGIVQFGGLMPGERIIVAKEDDNYVVLEGNRRVCACKLLVDRSLIPDVFKTRFPAADDTTIENIRVLNVDVVPSRTAAQSTLYNRHLKGPRRWSSLAKMNFVAREFRRGMSIESISELTGTNEGEVRKLIRQYNLVNLALNLPQWTPEDRKQLGMEGLKPSTFLRVFSGKSKKYDETATTLLRLTYTDDTNEPTSTLPKEIFEQAIYLIAREAFFNREFNTRCHIEDIPDLVELLSGFTLRKPNSPENRHSSPEGAEQHGEKSTGTSVSSDDGSNGVNHSGADNNGAYNEGNSPTPATPNETTPEKNPKVAPFFHNISWHGLDPGNADHSGLIQMATEIQKLSVSGHYGKYPVATAMLLRALLEQALKYYIKRIGQWNNLISFSKSPTGFDPMLSKILGFYRHDKNYEKFFPEKAIQKVFITCTGDDVIALLDTNVHNAAYARASRAELERLATKGLFTLIDWILNYK